MELCSADRAPQDIIHNRPIFDHGIASFLDMFVYQMADLQAFAQDRSSDGQWERFYMYARYVRALSVGRMQHERTLSLESISKIAEHTKDRNLFPVLTELIWHLGAQPEPVKILAPMLLCPSLRKLSLDVHMETPQFAIEPMLDGILSIVQKRCSHLFALRVHYEYRVRQFSKILFERCAQLPELTYIDCDSKLDSPPADNAQWISDIICHPNLTYVRVWIQAVEICLSSTQGGLRDNVHLHLYFRGDANMALALQSIPVLPITGFSVKMEHSQNPCAVYISELSASFASRFGTSLQAVHLDICLPTFEYKDLLRVVYYVTRPWCVFPELRDFVCLLEPGLSGLILQQLEDVTVMAAAWPLLEHLKLYFGPQYALPFRSLLSLARSCPLLKSVDMPLKGRIEQNTWPKDGSMKHGLERLYHQGRAKPSVDDATVVALRDAFPSAVIADHPSN